MKGKLDLLHAAKGHLELEFKSPEQAGGEITALMRRGYLILITIDGEDHRVTSFDSETGEYVVRETRKVWMKTKEVEERVHYQEADAKAVAPDPQAAPAGTPAAAEVHAATSPPAPPAPTTPEVRDEVVERRVPYKEAVVTAVAPISGG